MAETFYGPWVMRIINHGVGRVRIDGSDSSDGIFAGPLGVKVVEISGAQWTAELEWSLDGGTTWFPLTELGIVRRIASVNDTDGLVVDLIGANVPVSRWSVSFIYLDPAANPRGPEHPFDFVIPREWMRDPDPHNPPFRT